MLLGYARGKVGSLVFARRKGEQITRARNVSPSNPRTQSQMAQRMKMFAPVQLYKQSMRHFFKYAFMQKPHETIFNAFMRENISRAPWVSKELATAQAPIPFPARMSSGSLVGVDTNIAGVTTLVADALGAAIHQEGNYVMLSIRTSAAADDLTVGSFSSALINANSDLQQGDMLTFVLCHTSGLNMVGTQVNYDGVSPFVFKYLKVTLDVDSTMPLTDLGFNVEAADNDSAIVSMAIPANLIDHAIGGCAIVTRAVGSTVIASNSVLVLNEFASEVYDLMRTVSYRALAAASYKAQDDAYLRPSTVQAVVSGGVTPPADDDTGGDDEGAGGGGDDEPAEQIFVGVSSNNPSWGTVTGMGTYDKGTSVVLEATPNSGYRFVKWGDDNTDNPRTVIADVNGVTYSATFEPIS